MHCEPHQPGWGRGLVCSMACWAPPIPMMTKQASLFGSGRSGIPCDSAYIALEGHSFWETALITSDVAKQC